MGFDQPSAQALLGSAAQAIARLPEDVDSDNYWHGWHWMASQLQAWEAAATGLELQRAQERRNPDLAEDAAYLDAIVCVRKAEMAQKSGHASEAASLVQKQRPRYWKLLFFKQQKDKRWYDAVITEENDLFITLFLPNEQMQLRNRCNGEKLIPGQLCRVRVGKVNPLYNEIQVVDLQEY